MGTVIYTSTNNTQSLYAVGIPLHRLDLRASENYSHSNFVISFFPLSHGQLGGKHITRCAIISAARDNIYILRFSFYKDGNIFPFLYSPGHGQIVADRVSSPLGKSSVFHADSFHCISLCAVDLLSLLSDATHTHGLFVIVSPHLVSVSIQPSIVICHFYEVRAIASPIISAQPIRLFFTHPTSPPPCYLCGL